MRKLVFLPSRSSLYYPHNNISLQSRKIHIKIFIESMYMCSSLSPCTMHCNRLQLSYIQYKVIFWSILRRRIKKEKSLIMIPIRYDPILRLRSIILPRTGHAVSPACQLIHFIKELQHYHTPILILHSIIIKLIPVTILPRKVFSE